jgi:hypothetical protein
MVRSSLATPTTPAGAKRATELSSKSRPLHDTSTIDDTLWREVATHFNEEQILDVLMLCGWYHAISFAANGARVDLETGAPRFNDFAP